MSAQIALLTPHVKDLGGFQVQRLLPAFPTKMVGPFIFFDHFGPAAFSAGQGIDVRPHPHIGLATVTYLFEGAIVHRDSLGNMQRIEPGDVNWMTAGNGIVHSERTAAEDRVAGQRLHGLQTWVALPKSICPWVPGIPIRAFREPSAMGARSGRRPPSHREAAGRARWRSATRAASWHRSAVCPPW